MQCTSKEIGYSPSSGESLGIGGGGRSKYPRSLVIAVGTAVCEEVEVDIL